MIGRIGERIGTCHLDDAVYDPERLEVLPMPCFRVRFIKEVTTDTGTDVDTRQATFDVMAVNEDQAGELAKTRFCSDRQIGHWNNNADRMDVRRHPGGDASDDGVIVRPVTDTG